MASEQERLNLLSAIKKLQEEISELEASQSSSVQERLKNEKELEALKKKIVTEARKLKKVNSEITDMTKQYLEYQVTMDDRVKNIADSQFFIRDIEKQRVQNFNTIDTSLTSNLEKFNQMADLNIRMASLSADEIHQMELLNLEYLQLEGSLDRRGRGVSVQTEILKEQNTLAKQYASLSDTQKDIMEGQRQVLEGIKKTMMGTIETFVTLYGNAQGAFGGLVTLAGHLEHHISDVNKSFGYTLMDMNSAATSAAALSFFFDDAAGTARELTNQLGSVEGASFRTQLNVGLISETMGISNIEASQLVGNFARMNGGSTAIATDMIQTTKEFAKQNNVIPADVLSDLAGSAEEFALYSENGGENLIKAAVGARQLGVSLGTVTGIADNLLDFESSITKELELGAMLGRNINLNKARQLAYDGDIEKAAQETLKQLGGINAFNQMDVFQKRASAEAIGVSVGELQKMLDNQSRIKTQGDLINEKFSLMGSTINAGLNKYLGTSLEALGGMITATGQVGMGLKSMGIDTGKIAGNIASAAKSVLSKGFQMLSGGTGKGIGDTVTKSIGKPASKGIGNVGDGAGKSVGGIGKAISSINPTKLIAGAAALLIAAGAVFVLGKGLQQFKDVGINDVGVMAAGITVLAVALAALGGFGPIILAGAAALLVAAGAVWVLGKGLQEVAIGFSALDSISGVLTGLIGMTGSIMLLAGAFGTLAGSLTAVGIAGLIALPALLGLSMASKGLAVVADVLGIGGSSETTGGIEDGSLSEYQTQMLQKMDKLIQATMSTRDVYLDREKVTNVVMRTGERKTENVFGLGVA